MKKSKTNKTLLWIAIIWLVVVIISLILSPAIKLLSDYIMMFIWYGIPAFILIIIALIKWYMKR